MNVDLTVNNTEDQIYLEQYISAFKLLYGTNAYIGISYIKDKNFNYCAASQQFIQLLDVVGEEGKLIGKDDYQIPALQSYVSMVNTIRKQDIQICVERKAQKFLYITPDKYAYIAQKYPIINPHTNNVIGVHGQLSKFVSPHPLKYLSTLADSADCVPPLTADENEQIAAINKHLTERKHMILYLSIQRYSYSEVAEILTELGYKISKERVNDHINALKYIFSVTSKEELINKAIALNYNCYIPRKLFQVGSYLLDDDLLISEH